MVPLLSSLNQNWVRGVNLGGWLVLERFITPYQFALTDCHVAGNLCWYPGQISAPPSDSEQYQVCDLYQCQPLPEYPQDEYTLGQAFLSLSGNTSLQQDDEARRIAESWINTHVDNFMSQADIWDLREAGVTHIRVPLPHWIFGDVKIDEPWIVGRRWEAFVRLCQWCREAGIQVWPDIHTAPGSQNGFDNSGRQSAVISCQGWSNNETHVQRSLAVLQNLTAAVLEAGIQDVVTGVGLLNEPFKDCDRQVYEDFVLKGKHLVRQALGPQTCIYVSDMFLAETFNTGRWWLDPSEYYDTYLDSHYYHVFAEEPRALSPRQHIAYVCQKEFRDATSCCYEDPPQNRRASQGVKRMVGEFSAAYDILPVAMLTSVMQGINETGTAPHFDRELSHSRRRFLYNFVEAQMVAYEAASVGTAAAWFYWTVKMEGGAFAEWDFMRGIREGWIPTIPLPNQTSESVHGTCYDIIFRTDDSMDIVHEYPDPATLPKNNWQGVNIDDDVVVSHGDSLLNQGTTPVVHNDPRLLARVLLFFGALLAAYAIWRVFLRDNRKGQYTQLSAEEHAIRISV